MYGASKESGPLQRNNEFQTAGRPHQCPWNRCRRIQIKGLNPDGSLQLQHRWVHVQSARELCKKNPWNDELIKRRHACYLPICNARKASSVQQQNSLHDKCRIPGSLCCRGLLFRIQTLCLCFFDLEKCASNSSEERYYFYRIKFQLSFKALYYTSHVCVSTLWMSYQLDSRTVRLCHMSSAARCCDCLKPEKTEVVNMSQSIKCNAAQTELLPPSLADFWTPH